MYLSELKISNFRNFKDTTIKFNEGINVIIGHNNAGKTNVMKALSLVVDGKGSKRLDIDDFNKNVPLSLLKLNPPKVSIALNIAKGKNEEPDDLVCVGNWLTKLDPDYEALLTYEFFLPEREHENYKKGLDTISDTDVNACEKAWKIIKHEFLRFYSYKIWGGLPVNQTVADPESLQKFDFQFLNAIRDVERDLLTGRNTLSRDVLQFFLDYDLKEGLNKKVEADQVSIRAQIKARIENFSTLAGHTLTDLETRMNKGKEHILSYASETGASFNNATPDFEEAISEIELFSALRLIVKYETGIEMKIPATHNGLGYNNLIYISLLLAKMQVDSDGTYMGSNAKVFATLAIEEPEAHLHPAMQYKFLKFLQENKNKKKVRQIFVTTHSTHITSAVSLNEIICLHKENHETKIGYPGLVFQGANKSKNYVQRFLDATKSDMLFAQKVLFVEGLAEQVLLSTFAKYVNEAAKEKFQLQQATTPTGELYKSKLLEDNHIAVINVSGRFFDHFMYIFDGNQPYSIHKKVACITDRDPESKKKTNGVYTKCYPFEVNSDPANFDYQFNLNANKYAIGTHPNIAFFSQDPIKGKTLEYDLILHNPTLELLLTSSISNAAELKDLMKVYSEGKELQDFEAKLRSSEENSRIKEGIRNNTSWNLKDKKEAMIAARYLNSVGKGENALELAYALEENLSKKGSAEYKEFIVPEYIKQAVIWLCQ